MRQLLTGKQINSYITETYTEEQGNLRTTILKKDIYKMSSKEFTNLLRIGCEIEQTEKHTYLVILKKIEVLK